MLLTRRVPVAWLNLTHSKARFVLSVLGISFAVVLMLVQLGFWRALLDSQTGIIHATDADLFIVPAAMSTLSGGQDFPLIRVRQAAAIPGVRLAQPLYIRYFPFMWTNQSDDPDLLPQWPIRVLAFRAEQSDLAIDPRRVPQVASLRERLLDPNVVLIDTKSKSQYDLIRDWRRHGIDPVGREREVGGRRLRIVGTFQLGTDFRHGRQSDHEHAKSR